MNKALKLTAIGALAAEVLYGFFTFFIGTIYVIADKTLRNFKGWLFGFADVILPIMFATAVIAVLAIIIIKSLNSGGKNIVAEIIGLIYFSGVFNVFAFIPNLIRNKLINKMIMMDARSYTRVYSSYAAFRNVGSYVAFFGCIATTLIIIACTLSIVNKKVIAKEDTAAKEEAAPAEAAE